MEVIRAGAIRDEYGDARKTEIIADKRDLTMGRPDPEETLVLTLTARRLR